MAHDDDLIAAAEQQMRTLHAARTRTQADLAEARAYGDPGTIGTEIQTLANVDQQIQALADLARRHAQAQNPPQQAPQSDQEFLSKAPERMDYNDTYRIASKSRHGVDMDAFKAGIAEVQRRRARGE
jgi:hypothetical protein